MNKLLLYVIGFVFLLNSCSEKPFKDYTIKKIEESVWISDMEDYYPIENSLMLIFEHDFKDSIDVYVENKIISSNFYKTKPNLSVVPIFDRIEGDIYREGKEVKIVLTQKKEYVKFKIRKNYSYAYIYKDENGKWLVEFSEYQRRYY